MKPGTNPLLRTPARELRRHALPLVAVALALAVALAVVTRIVPGAVGRDAPAAVVTATSTATAASGPAATATPTIAATPVAAVTATSTATAASGPAATATPTTVTRTLTRQCETECTLVFTATGGADVQLTINHIGHLADSHPLGADGTGSRVQVTGTGTFQASATATGWVDLTAAEPDR